MRERSEAKWLDKCLQARVVQVLMANFLGRAAATIVLPKVASRLFQVQVGDLISTFAVQGSPAPALHSGGRSSDEESDIGKPFICHATFLELFLL